MTTATTEPQICKETGTEDYDDCDDHEDGEEDEEDCTTREDIRTMRTEEESRQEQENEEQIIEYLKRSDTAVIFPEPVSVFGSKDCLADDEEQEDKKQNRETKTKVTGSASEYYCC